MELQKKRKILSSSLKFFLHFFKSKVILFSSVKLWKGSGNLENHIESINESVDRL